MGVYLNTIIPHNFRDHENKEVVRRFLHQTAAKIVAAYGYEYKEEYIHIDMDDEYPDDISFMFVGEMEDESCVLFFKLLKDVFVLESGFDYWQLQQFHNGESFLREDSRLIAKALGQSELWYCEHTVGNNGGGLNGLDITLNQWLEQIKERIGTEIPEWHILPEGEFPGYRDNDNACLHCIFHDTIEKE